jgi:oligopeptide/dipeptide ABC transporter ATP-binding protein
MLELEHLTVRYGSGRNTLLAVDGVSIGVPVGTTVGLVGESGSGKSTIARALVGLVPVAGGRILLEGEDVTPHKARNSPRFRSRVQMVFQDPHASLNPRMTVGDAIDEALLVQGVPRRERGSETLRTLELVGLSRSALDRYPHQFSGGQKQRIALARALAVRPELLILDEVTSSLDVSVQATVLNLLKQLQTELGLTFLFISHDLSVVGYMSDHVVVMYLGRVVEQGKGDELFAQPRHPYTRGLLESLPRLTAKRTKAPILGSAPDPRDPPSGCRFRTRCPMGPSVDSSPRRSVCIEKDPQTIASLQPHLSACHFATEVPPPSPAVAQTVPGDPVGDRL